MKRIIVFISLILVTLSSIAQVPAGMGGRAAGQNMNMGHFYGKIVDANKKGVDGATLQIKGTKFDPVTKKSAEVILGTMLSASNGDFSFENLPVMGNFKLIISAIGYKKIEKQLSFGIKMGGGQSMQEMMALVDKDLGNIKLEESPTDLQSVTVTSSAKPQFEMGIDRKIFNVDKNLTSTGQTAVEVMKSIPNLNVDIDGNVTLRNAAPTLLIDNRPTTLTMDQIPADIIDRVEIITNPSAKYDATGGNAGILNIVLKKNRKNGYNGGIRSGIDMRGRFNGGGDMNVRNNKINFSLNANLNGRKSISSSQTDREILGSAVPTKVFTDNQSNGQGSFNFYRGGIDYFPDNRNTFSLYGNLMQGSMGSNGTQTIDSLLGTTLKSGYQLTNSSNFDFANKGAQLSFKHLFEEKGHELSIDYNYNKSDNNNWSKINSTYLNQSSEGKGNNTNNSINLDYAREFAGDVKFESGLKYSDRSEFNARDQFKIVGNTKSLLTSASNQYKYSENVYAAYTNLNLKHNNWSYQLGLRAESRGYKGNILNYQGIESKEFNTSYPISLFPSAFVNYKKNDKEDFQFNYSKRISPPNFFQLIPFADYTDPQNISIGNPGLKPQFTHSFEVAYNNAYKKGSNFLATAYYKYSTDLITNYVYRDINKTTGDSAYFSSSINANTATVYGLELSNKTAITKWWDLNLSFNLFKSAISATIPGQNVNNDLTSWFSKMNSTFKLPKGYSFQLSGQYQAKTILPPGGSSAEGGGRMGGRGMGFGGPQSTAQGYNLPYYDFDMAIKKDWTLSGGRTASLSLSVNDVFKTRVNKTHSESTYFIQNVSRIRDQQLFRLNFSYRFGKFDVNLLKRKTKGEDGGMMDQMPQ